MKPLSYRLLNEQTPVQFILKSIVATPSDLLPTVELYEEESKETFIGNVNLLENTSFEGFKKKLEEREVYDALTAEEKKTKPAPEVPKVEVSRVSHEEFPFMR